LNPEPIEPDTKDWTWVLDRRCDECGFDASTLPPEAVPQVVRGNGIEWRPLLLADDGTPRPGVAERPSPDRWSVLEYACHVRDVYELYAQRLQLMLTQDGAAFSNWDQDAAAVEDRYNEQDPAAVAEAIESGARTIAEAFDAVEGDEWGRTGVRSDGAHFTVDTFARYFVHDPVHHVYDVEENYRRLTPG
jgi:DinB superfamily